MIKEHFKEHRSLAKIKGQMHRQHDFQLRAVKLKEAGLEPVGWHKLICAFSTFLSNSFEINLSMLTRQGSEIPISLISLRVTAYTANLTVSLVSTDLFWKVCVMVGFIWSLVLYNLRL